MTFLYGDLCHSVALPPLDVPLFGRPVRTLRVAPITDPVPGPEREAEPTPTTEAARC